jgi:Protein of unknown function (DUF3011)
MALSPGSLARRFCVIGGLLLIATPAAADKTITCESDGAYRYCRVDTFGKAILVKEISSGVCVGGTNWAYDRQGVWVASGCKGEFAVNEAWRGGQPGGLTKPTPEPTAKVHKWAVGTFTTHHQDWDTPFTITIEADGVTHLETNSWEAALRRRHHSRADTGRDGLRSQEGPEGRFGGDEPDQQAARRPGHGSGSSEVAP